ncbi:hypothetical protein MUY14_08110 [Amycolatopsis sp. FBCC-B4732]|uniref:hypothetical protein n=1 Tax=Amycolatopsis sp. FBCC-B4732 TaxID=3079339 RepID=UPI001FF44C60|nr:hypothetical protein [Amycolatopsis sp. FBCC-B4732]UOX90575.1 hypothetical protein MUY14_08110 [Amycolatopsis sp. FBCC-B4732]
MAERIGRVQQVILLCLLALCVTAMHHVSASDDEPHTVATTSVSTSMSAGTGSGEHHAPGPDGAHDTLHLCLAVLTAIGALLLARLLFVRRPEAGNPVPRSYPRGSSIPERPPDRPGRSVLNVLCVLRV